jgi:hypothetical protein
MWLGNAQEPYNVHEKPGHRSSRAYQVSEGQLVQRRLKLGITDDAGFVDAYVVNPMSEGVGSKVFSSGILLGRPVATSSRSFAASYPSASRR